MAEFCIEVILFSYVLRIKLNKFLVNASAVRKQDLKKKKDENYVFSIIFHL